MKRVLMVAYHFPPLAGSSGIQRTLCFARDLPAHGWQPSILSAHPRAYERTSHALLADLPPTLEVRRAFALDASRHLSVLGRYPRSFALPDRWLSWLPFAVASGMAMIRRHRPDALWSTYPIATAHLIGAALSRLTGIPWVADFRDPMAHDGYPDNPRTTESYLRTERKVFSRAGRTVFATNGAARLYAQRYPDAASAMRVVENGFDRVAFGAIARTSDDALNPGKLTILHSGTVYPEWRHPDSLFAALRALVDEGSLDGETLRVRFRGAEHEALVSDSARRHGVDHMVQVLPNLDYRPALAEMLRADALLILQSSGCNDQIPAKLYEYIATRRPILALTDAAGDTADALRRAGGTAIAPLDAPPEIAALLRAWLPLVRTGRAAVPTEEAVASCSRSERTRELARVLGEVQRSTPHSISPAH